MMANAITLSNEQQAILATLPYRTATTTGGPGRLIRITAAAGAGKTTTLLELAEHASSFPNNYDCIYYLTFAKAAANDAMERFQKRKIKARIVARTLHSAAYHLLAGIADETSKEDDAVWNTNIWQDADIKKWIAGECSDAIDSFLAPCLQEIASRSRGMNNPQVQRSHNQAAKEQVQFFIFKSLQLFCHSKFSEAEYDGITPVPFGRDYYPAKIFHGPHGRGNSYGFLPQIYENQVGFYAKQAITLWHLVKKQKLRAFDFDMKRAQLNNLLIPCSLLLVDECQDMDACQIDWIRQQTGSGTHVYLVGDPAQAIYQFRGAKPKFLQELKADHDMKLTESFRFGKAVSNIANLVLYAKENSPQTKMDKFGRHVNWTPYRVRTGTSRESFVYTEDFLSHWRTKKITVIARSNVVLFMEALRIMGFIVEGDDDDDGTEPGTTFVFDPEAIPRFHMNGRGESSGLKLWIRTIEMVEAVYNLFALGKEQYVLLDNRMFPDFHGKHVTWEQFVKEVSDRELTKYGVAVDVVQHCQGKTLLAIDAFHKYVIDRDYSADQAHIILTTCHSAKGMEWDNVQVCDDFIALASFKREQTHSRTPTSSPVKIPRYIDKWDFAFQEWGDDLNLLYVACTRAKVNLCIPPQVWKVICIFDSALHTREMIGQGVSMMAFTLPGPTILKLSSDDVESFVIGLVHPFLDELKTPVNERLWNILISNDEDEETCGPNLVTPSP